MTTETKGIAIVWQNDYEGVFEMPIVLAKYNGSITIEQSGNSIQLTDEHVEELVKALRKIVKKKFEDK